MDEITKQMCEERMAVARAMLDIADFLLENSEAEMDFAKDWMNKVESGEFGDGKETEIMLDMSNRNMLEADEDLKLSILLSAKATKYLDEVKLLSRG